MFQPPASLPPQPAYDSLIKDLERSRSEQIEQASMVEFNLSPESIEAYNQSMLSNQSVIHSMNQSHIHNTPLKLPAAADSTPMRPEGARGSRRRGQSNDPPTSGDINARIQEAFANNTLYDVHQTPSRSQIRREQDEDDEATPRRGLKPTMPAPLPMNIPAPPTPSSAMMEQYSGVGTPVSAIKSTTNIPMVQHPTPPPSPPKDNLSANNTANSSLLSQFHPEALLLHPSDSQVKPIVGNKAIETIESIDFNEAALPFESMVGADRLDNMPQSDLEVHLTQVYKALHKAAVTSQSATPTNAYNSNNVPISMTVVNALSDRVNILAYLSHISYSSEVSYLASMTVNTIFNKAIFNI